MTTERKLDRENQVEHILEVGFNNILIRNILISTNKIKFLGSHL